MNKKNRRIDLQLTGMAGEFLVTGKLFKLGLQASITLGNAKKVDILAYNEITGKNFNIQVKTLRKSNCFLIKKENVEPDHFYVFVVLNDFSKEEDYFIIQGKEILEDIDIFFGTSYTRDIPSTMPAINLGPLKNYKNNWSIFLNKDA
jgi:hypothetical protein